jgi:hypothetical protein
MPSHLSRFFLALLVLGLAIGAADAATAEIGPNAISEGDRVTIAVRDLPNGTVFSLRLEGEFGVTPNESYRFSAENLTMPFELQKGKVAAVVENTATNRLTVLRKDTRVRAGGPSKNGRFTTEENVSTAAGTYDEMTIEGTTLADASTVRTRLELTGIKRGPDDATIKFVERGIEKGTLRVAVYANTEKIGEQEIALGVPTPTATRAGIPGVVTIAAGAIALCLAARRRRR